MTPRLKPPSAVSAPGKVLLAGGYLVLDRAHTGLVFGLDARIHAVVGSSRLALSEAPAAVSEALQGSSEAPQGSSEAPQGLSGRRSGSLVRVRSPQFRGAEWTYAWDAETGLRAGAQAEAGRNVFVEMAVGFALGYVDAVQQGAVEGRDVWVAVLADAGYYSAGARADTTEGRFVAFGKSIADCPKTGLGSSAALVTAVAAALLVHLLPANEFSLGSEQGRRRLHNLAQAAHSAAQGKVGSGFDVGSAVYGSCVYKRFSPGVLDGIGDASSEGFARRLKDVVDETGDVEWDTEILKEKVSIPKGLRLVMCDVECGSQTPGMVRKVLEWRKNNPKDAARIWGALQEQNDSLAAELVRLAETQDRSYDALRQRISAIRAAVREMSNESGVPIEPQAQTELLDACSQVAGVIGGVAPGAGGYDAIALLLEDKPDVVASLSKLVAKWKFEGEEDGRRINGHVRLLEVRGEMSGVREEDASEYETWTAGMATATPMSS